MLNPITGKPLRFSELKFMALSPKHFRHACLAPRKVTRGMRIGTGAHVILLGQRPGHLVVRYEGKERKGSAWKEFEAETLAAVSEGTQVDILTAPEWEEAQAIADAVREDPKASRLFEAGMRYEVPLEWEAGGFHCSTGGLDAIGLGRLIDLKITNSTEPEKWGRLSFNMLYPQQLAFYQEGCEAHGIDTSRGLFLLGVESSAPYDVTEFELDASSIELGRKSLTMWRERLRGCALSDHWPGYVQTTQKLTPAEWMLGEDLGDEPEEEGEAA